MQSNGDPLGCGPMIDPGARVYIAIADGQGELVTGSIEFFLARPEFDEVHGSHSVVRGTWHAVQARGKRIERPRRPLRGLAARGANSVLISGLTSAVVPRRLKADW